MTTMQQLIHQAESLTTRLRSLINYTTAAATSAQLNHTAAAMAYQTEETERWQTAEESLADSHSRLHDTHHILKQFTADLIDAQEDDHSDPTHARITAIYAAALANVAEYLNETENQLRHEINTLFNLEK